MVDKVRQCSTKPDEAAAFFQTILSPLPADRVKALDTLWCAEAVKRMFAETGTDYKAGVGIVMARTRLQASQHKKPSLCAALCGCFGPFESQRREDDSCPPAKKMYGAAAPSLADGGKLDIVASSASAAHDSQSEAQALQNSDLQPTAPLFLSQRCLRQMRKVIMLKSKRKGSATAQQGVSRLHEEQTKCDVSATPSAAVTPPEECSTRRKEGQQALQAGPVSVAASAVSGTSQQLQCGAAPCNDEAGQPIVDRYVSCICNEFAAHPLSCMCASFLTRAQELHSTFQCIVV